MNILILHPSFPGQFLYLAPYLAKNPENRVYFLSKENAIGINFEGVRLGIYQPPAKEAVELAAKTGVLSTCADAVLTGEQIVKSLHFMKEKEHFKPDIIIGHTGWGSMLFTKDYYPDVPTLGYFEWYYRAEHGDSYWWPDEQADIGARIGIRVKNAHHLLSLDACDHGITPTKWQLAQFPDRYQDKISVIYDGVDMGYCQPVEEPQALDLPDIDLHLPQGTEIVTYVARGFEAIRGFPQFMDAMRILLAERPRCHVVLVGDDRVCYGKSLKDSTYLKREEEKGYDKQRMHFVGSRNRGDFRRVLQASSCHVYLTRPFITSWSFLECMGFGLPIVASETPPCEEFIQDGKNGLLADFRSPHHIARQVARLLDNRQLARSLGSAARRTVVEGGYALDDCLRRQEDLIYRIVNDAVERKHLPKK